MTYQQKKFVITILIYILLLIIFISFFLQIYYVALSCITLLIILFIYYKTICHIKETTLCLIVKNDKVLMMKRNKKKGDVHLNKYNGLGGKVERHESKTHCVIREVYEEAGIILTNYQYVGKVVFKNFGYKVGKEVMYCYVGYDYVNEISECNEGDLEWIDIDKVLTLPLWEGDKYFLMNIITNQKFNGYLHYDGDKVINYSIKLRG